MRTPAIVFVCGSDDFPEPASLYATLHELRAKYIYYQHAGLDDQNNVHHYARHYCAELNIPGDYGDWKAREALVNRWLLHEPEAPHVAIFCWLNPKCKETAEFFEIAQRIGCLREFFHLGKPPEAAR